MATIPLLGSHVELEQCILALLTPYQPLISLVCKSWYSCSSSKTLSLVTLLNHLCTVGDTRLLELILPKCRYLYPSLLLSAVKGDQLAVVQYLSSLGLPMTASTLREAHKVAFAYFDSRQSRMICYRSLQRELAILRYCSTWVRSASFLSVH